MKVYNPTDKIYLKGYNGRELEIIFKYNPDYIIWAIENVENFAINMAAFKKLPPPTPVVHGFYSYEQSFAELYHRKFNLGTIPSDIPWKYHYGNELITLVEEFIRDEGFRPKTINFKFSSELEKINKDKIENYNIEFEKETQDYIHELKRKMQSYAEPKYESAIFTEWFIQNFSFYNKRALILIDSIYEDCLYCCQNPVFKERFGNGRELVCGELIDMLIADAVFTSMINKQDAFRDGQLSKKDIEGFLKSAVKVKFNQENKFGKKEPGNYPFPLEDDEERLSWDNYYEDNDPYEELYN